MTSTLSLVRHPKDPEKLGGRPYLPAPHHPAVVNGHTVYPGKVQQADDWGSILVSGRNNTKIGAVVQKGRWKGFPIFTLTLEERATCPRSCRQWRTCMGNNMHLAGRWASGPLLERFLQQEVLMLQDNHPGGFVVRLHVLGDFYSVEYVYTWHALMNLCPALNVFGFTARIDPADPITVAIAEIRREFPTRWWVRFSDAAMDTMATEVVDLPEQASPGSIVCPQQTDRTLLCATCGLCWASKSNIAWLRH
jgi:hypothetical protein